jgi:hypothetical protein
VLEIVEESVRFQVETTEDAEATIGVEAELEVELELDAGVEVEVLEVGLEVRTAL